MNPSIAKELATLEERTTDQLIERYAELYGQQVRTRHRGYLLRKVAWRLQALAEGGLSERARKRAAELADEADVRVMAPRPAPVRAENPTQRSAPRPVATEPRLPSPGTVLNRPYKGRHLQVIVRADGFEFEGALYKTLSAVAKAITGTHINGFYFFRLGETR